MNAIKKFLCIVLSLCLPNYLSNVQASEFYSNFNEIASKYSINNRLPSVASDLTYRIPPYHQILCNAAYLMPCGLCDKEKTGSTIASCKEVSLIPSMNKKFTFLNLEDRRCSQKPM